MEIKGTNIYLTRGDTARITYEIEIDPIFVIQDFYFTVRINSYSEHLLIGKEWHLNPEETSTGVVKDGNKFSVNILHEDTTNLDFEEYRYDVQIKYTDSQEGINAPIEVLTVIKPSIFAVTEEVTRG